MNMKLSQLFLFFSTVNCILITPAFSQTEVNNNYPAIFQPASTSNNNNEDVQDVQKNQEIRDTQDTQDTKNNDFGSYYLSAKLWLTFIQLLCIYYIIEKTPKLLPLLELNTYLTLL